MPETPDRPHRTGLFAIDLMIAVCAIIVSAASLWVALRADQTQEQLLKSSVWPHVEFDSSDATPTGAKQLVFEVRNDGVGPAIVRSVAVSYNGHYYATLRELLKACCNIEVPRNIFASTLQNRVIAARDVIEFIEMPADKVDEAEYEQILPHRFNIELQMCYCSVLGDCWFFDTLRGPAEPIAVKRCPPAQQPQYQT